MKYFAALLLSEGADPAEAIDPRLESVFGPADYIGPPRPFDMTDYYAPEMGGGLVRVIVSFRDLGDPAGLAAAKSSCARVERDLSAAGSRRINIDPGYIDYFKAVLASFKEGPQKIYLGEGAWADTVLMYENGRWRDLPWSFPDFRAGRYDEEFAAIRDIYRAQRRALSLGGTP